MNLFATNKPKIQEILKSTFLISCNNAIILRDGLQSSISHSLHMDVPSTNLHPGIICAIALIPTALIVILVIVIVRGFDLVPNWTTWGSHILARRRGSLQDDAAFPNDSRNTIASNSTTQSQFIGQSEEVQVVPPVPARIIRHTRPVRHGNLPAQWRTKPTAPSYHQAGPK